MSQEFIWQKKKRINAGHENRVSLRKRRKRQRETHATKNSRALIYLRRFFVGLDPALFYTLDRELVSEYCGSSCKQRKLLSNRWKNKHRAPGSRLFDRAIQSHERFNVPTQSLSLLYTHFALTIFPYTLFIAIPLPRNTTYDIGTWNFSWIIATIHPAEEPPRSNFSIGLVITCNVESRDTSKSRKI